MKMEPCPDLTDEAAFYLLGVCDTCVSGYLVGTCVPGKLVGGYLGYQGALRLGDGGRVSLRRILSPPLCVGSNDLHVYPGNRDLGLPNHIIITIIT